MLDIRDIENPVIDMRDDRFIYYESGADYRAKTGLEPPSLPGKPCKMWVPKVAEADFQPMLIHRLPSSSWYSLDPPMDYGKPIMESVFLTKGRAYFLNFWPDGSHGPENSLSGNEDPPLRQPQANEQLFRSWFPGAPNTWADASKQTIKNPTVLAGSEQDWTWIRSTLTAIANAVGAKL